MAEAFVRASANGVRFAVRLTPKGGRDAIEGWTKVADGRVYLKARVSAAPHDGAANDALVALLARALGIAKSKVHIVSGATARIKLVEVEGEGEALAAKLSQWEKNP